MGVKDGGAAFPRTTEVVSDRTEAADYKHHGVQGMSLRDYFAAKALPVMLDAALAAGLSNPFLPATADAYRAADEMLKAREA